jgi:hypothetical protein
MSGALKLAPAPPKIEPVQTNGEPQEACPTLSFHPIAEIFPLIEGAAFEALVADIKANGQRDAIVRYQGKILDGRNLHRACVKAGVTPRIDEYDGDDPLRYIISKKFRRQHLDQSQRGMVGARIATLSRGHPGQTGKFADIPTQPEVAKLLSVGVRTIRHAATVLDRGAIELQQAVDCGKVAVSTASIIAKKCDHQRQRKLVAGGAEEIAKAIKNFSAGAKPKADTTSHKNKQEPDTQDAADNKASVPQVAPTAGPPTAPGQNDAELADHEAAGQTNHDEEDVFVQLKAIWERADEQVRQRFFTEVLKMDLALSADRSDVAS